MYLGGGERDVPTNAHRRLAEAGMPYMRYVPRVDTTRAFARGEHNVVFIGQIPRLLPLPYVPWAIDLLAQEYASKWVLQTQPNGCAKVWVETDAQCELLVELNKRLMFDVCGVFLARTHDEVRTMEDYQQALQVSGPIDSRVPRNGALLERLRPPQAPKQAATAPSHPTVYGATNNTPGFGAPHPPYGSTPVPVMTHVYGGAPQPGFHTGFHQPFTTAPTAFFGAPPPAM